MSTQNPHGNTETSYTQSSQNQPIEIEKRDTSRPGLFNWLTLSFLFVPGILAAVLSWRVFDWRIQSLEPFLTAITIFAGFLFALLIFVFQLRMQIHYDPRTQQRSNVPDYINELFQLTLYSTVYAVALTALIAGVWGSLSAEQPVPVLLSAMLVGLLVIFVFALSLICIRTAGAYRIASEGTEFKKP